MSFNELKLIVTKLESVIQENLAQLNAESTAVGEEIYNLINSLKSILEQEQSVGKDYLSSGYTFIRHLPLAIAILDREMNYLAVSDRWISDYKLEESELIGRNYYDVFPELPTRWRKDFERCLAGRVKVLGQEEDFWVRQNGTVDWLRWQARPWHNYEGEIGGLTVCSEVITEQKLLQQKIQSTEEQMRAVFAGMNELVFTVELHNDSILILPTKFFDVYDQATVDRIIVQTQEQLFGSSEADSYRTSIERVLQEQLTINFEYSLQLDDSPLERREAASPSKIASRENARQSSEALLVESLPADDFSHRDTSLIWFSVNISPISDSSVIWIARDVTNRKETEEEILYAEKELAQITLESIGDGVITTDAYGEIKYLNPTAEHLTGWLANEAQGKPLNEVFCLINESNKEAVSNPIERVSRSHRVCKLTAKNSLLGRNGTCYEIEGLASPIMNRQSKLVGTAIVFRDVTKARKMARKLSWQASHDSLTKLHNRRKFEEYAARAISNAQLYQNHHALCYLDLDRFKVINDTCGHAAGDKLLKQVTKMLQKIIRRADVFARLGGDEFGIIFHQCPIEIALNCANELRKLIEDFRFIWSDKVFRIGVSIGLVEIESTTEKLGSLLNSADAACYVAKQQGGNYVHLCHEQDSVVVKRQGERQWIEKINSALDKNYFRLYVQKIVPIQDNFVSVISPLRDRFHYEILLRLSDESGNIILPGAFLPAAERYGLMPAIDRWVISNFLAGYEFYCQSFSQLELDAASKLFTINLSGASINNQEFCKFLREQFEHYSIPPQTICFEITETVAITNLDRANSLINQLKELGCSIALDDFGSGMSSLTYLKNLPIDYLKIDGSFVTNIANDEVDYATVECFNHISQIMNIKTIAEFVENQATLNNLKQIGIDYAQGYGIERPKPLVWD